MPAFQRIHRRLEGLGIIGVGIVDAAHETDGPASFHPVGLRVVRLDWNHDPSDEERLRAQSALVNADAAHELDEWRPKDMPRLFAEIGSLPTADQQKLTRLAVAELLTGQPDIAREFGIPLDGHEPNV